MPQPSTKTVGSVTSKKTKAIQTYMSFKEKID